MSTGGLLPTRRPRTWIALAMGGLLAASALALGIFHVAATASGGSTGSAIGYYQVVVLKGMLPQLLLTLGGVPLLRRYRRRKAGPAHAAEAADPAPLSLGIEIAVLASLAYCIVVPLLLTVPFPGWPALRMNAPLERIGSFLGMTAAVTLAAWLPLVWLRRGESRARGDESG